MDYSKNLNYYWNNSNSNWLLISITISNLFALFDCKVFNRQDFNQILTKPIIINFKKKWRDRIRSAKTKTSNSMTSSFSRSCSRHLMSKMTWLIMIFRPRVSVMFIIWGHGGIPSLQSPQIITKKEPVYTREPSRIYLGATSSGSISLKSLACTWSSMICLPSQSTMTWWMSSMKRLLKPCSTCQRYGLTMPTSSLSRCK